MDQETPIGEHEWNKGFFGMRGRCSRCGARASLAMNGPCEWRPSIRPVRDPDRPDLITRGGYSIERDPAALRHA